MPFNAATFGSVRSLIIFSVTFYLCVMFYFHSRLSNEDFGISRLERLTRDRRPSKKNVLKLPNDIYVAKDGAMKTKSGQVKVKRADDLSLLDGVMVDNSLQAEQIRKGPAKLNAYRRQRIRYKDQVKGRPEKLYEQRLRARQDRDRDVPRNAGLKSKPTTVWMKAEQYNALKMNNIKINKLDKKQASPALKANNRIVNVLRRQNITTVNAKVNGQIPSKSLYGIKENIVKTGRMSENVNRLLRVNKQYLDRGNSFNRDPVVNREFIEVLSNIWVYTAYIDERVGRFIRFIGIAYREEENIKEKFICHFERGRFSVGKFYRTCEDHMQLYAAYVISCPVPKTSSMQDIFLNGVTVSNSSALYGRSIRVISNRYSGPKKQFNVCIPPLFGNLTADKIIEFVEVNKLLGANHFTFYKESSTLDKNLTKVLNIYRKKGDVSVIPWKLPIKTESIWYHGQSASIWDCLFRSMYSFDYVAFHDIDEIIVPRVVKSWKAMIDFLLKTRKDGDRIAAFRFESAEFDNGRNALPSFPEEIRTLITLHTIWRTKRTDGARTKLIVDPLKVFEIGIHHISKPISDKFLTLDVTSNLALLHHYKKCSARIRSSCKDFVQDVSLWRFYPDIVNNVRKMKQKVKTSI